MNENENEKKNNDTEYWKANKRLMFTCLILWFVVSFGFGIILRPVLDTIHIGGYPLGFWFAQQGSIYAFVALIFFYVHRMSVLDRKFEVDED